MMGNKVSDPEEGERPSANSGQAGMNPPRRGVAGSTVGALSRRRGRLLERPGNDSDSDSDPDPDSDFDWMRASF